MMLDILPQPSQGFEWVQALPGPALVCRPLEVVADHLFTTRGWRLGSLPAADEAAWQEIAGALRIAPADVVRARQVHGASVLSCRCRDDSPQRHPSQIEADAIVTDDPRLGLVVQTADCVPVLLADSKRGVVAVAHAGWRGVAARVVHEAVSALSDQCGSRPADLIAAIGPSIGPCCYEVGPDVRERFESAGFAEASLARWFSREAAISRSHRSIATRHNSSRSYFLDLWTAVGDQLLMAGIPAEARHIAGLCTASHPELFCSYRRDGSPAGRLAGAIRAKAS